MSISFKKPKNQISSIQILRCLAAWLVVFHHYNQVFFSWNMSESILGENFGYFSEHYGKLGVDIFFVISGFIIFLTANRNMEPVSFFKNRVLRVVPPYWFFTFFLLILSFQIPSQIRSDWTWVSLMKSLLFIHHDNPSDTLGSYPYLTVGWTLIFEMYFYFICSICLFFCKKYWFIIVFLLLFFSTSNYFWWVDFYFLSFFFKSGYTKEFAIGIAIGYVYIRGYIPIGNILALSVLITSIILFYSSGAQGNKYMAISTLVLGSLMIKESTVNIKAFIFAKHLGNISYSTYLGHAIVLPILLNLFGKYPFHYNEILLFSSYVVLVYGMSVISYKYIENGILTKVLRNLS